MNDARCLNINHQENLAKIICNSNLVVLESRVIIESLRKELTLPCEIINDKTKLFKNGNSFLMLKGFQYGKIIDGMSIF